LVTFEKWTGEMHHGVVYWTIRKSCYAGRRRGSVVKRDDIIMKDGLTMKHPNLPNLPEILQGVLMDILHWLDFFDMKIWLHLGVVVGWCL
jgi:hypothetical protein